ncbi:hypothetical protein OC842_007886, partial [Tilletia horrida]
MDWPPQHFEWVPGLENKRVRCMICADSASSTAGLKRSSAQAHIATRGHQRSLDVLTHLQSSIHQHSSNAEDEGLQGTGVGKAALQLDEDTLMHDVEMGDHDHQHAMSPPPSPSPELPDWMDSDASECAASSHDDGSMNEAVLLEDLPQFADLGDAEFHPYPSRLVFLLHTIASNPRNPLSVAQIQLVLQLLRWLGYHEAPSYDKYRAGVQEAMRNISKASERAEEVQGREGHKFCFTSISQALSRDFANPEARQEMTFYPRDDANIADLMDGQWVHSLRDARAPPMVRLQDERHAFRGEAVQLKDGSFMLVTAWFQRDGSPHGWGLQCERDEK